MNSEEMEQTNNEQQQLPIYCGKLISGELIIGRLQNNILINCLKVNMNYDVVTSNMNVNFTPILYPLSNALESIQLNNILFLKPAEPNIIVMYVNNLLRYINQELTKNTSELNQKINNIQKETETAETKED